MYILGLSLEKPYYTKNITLFKHHVQLLTQFPQNSQPTLFMNIRSTACMSACLLYPKHHWRYISSLAPLLLRPGSDPAV